MSQLPPNDEPYWFRGGQPLAGHQSRPALPAAADVVIIGAGLTGAATAYHFGSVLKVVPRSELRDAAFEVAMSIAAKSPVVIRAAKESLNGIDLWDVKRSYRFEQGFTFELNLTGVSDERRNDFAGTDKAAAESAATATAGAEAAAPTTAGVDRAAAVPTTDN